MKNSKGAKFLEKILPINEESHACRNVSINFFLGCVSTLQVKLSMFFMQSCWHSRGCFIIISTRYCSVKSLFILIWHTRTRICISFSLFCCMNDVASSVSYPFRKNVTFDGRICHFPSKCRNPLETESFVNKIWEQVGKYGLYAHKPKTDINVYRSDLFCSNVPVYDFLLRSSS